MTRGLNVRLIIYKAYTSASLASICNFLSFYRHSPYSLGLLARRDTKIDKFFILQRNWVRDDLIDGIKIKTNMPVMSFIHLESNFLGFYLSWIYWKNYDKTHIFMVWEKY